MIRLSKSIVGIREAEAVNLVITQDGYLGMGAEVGLFEKELAEYLNVKPNEVVCVNSGTSALHLAIDAVTTDGDEVLVPSLTFLSSYQAISACGAVPVSCEVYEDTLTIDLEYAASKITSKTKAIMAVHYASNPAKIEELYQFAEKFNLRVIEDAAHAFGCSHLGRKIGSFGDIICFSFDGIKNITSGEGGAIVTKDASVLAIVRDTRLLAIEKDSEQRYQGKRSWDFDVKRQGYRYHMSNIFAAIGRVQLNRLDQEFAPKRKLLLERYRELLEGNKKIKLQRLEDGADIVAHIFPIRVLNGDRDKLRDFLEQSEVPTGIHYKPNHLLTFYGAPNLILPVTEQIYLEILTLPLHPELEIQEVELICGLINKFLN